MTERVPATATTRLIYSPHNGGLTGVTFFTRAVELRPDMDCRVVVEAAVPVYDVETADEAIRIAISKTGKMLNPDLSYVEIEMGERTSPDGKELPPAFIAADEALVALELEMTVFNVEQEEHASRVARKEIGGQLENVPLTVLSVERVDDTDDEAEVDEPADEPASSPADSSGREASGPEDSADTPEGEDDDLLPEMDDLVEGS